MTMSIADNLIVYRHRDAEPPSERAPPWAGYIEIRQRADRSSRSESCGVRRHLRRRSRAAINKNSSSRGSLNANPTLIIAHNPYRGLDVAATEAVRRSLLQARDAGAAVVLISPDLDDLFDISNRILFLTEGSDIGLRGPSLDDRPCDWCAAWGDVAVKPEVATRMFCRSLGPHRSRNSGHSLVAGGLFAARQRRPTHGARRDAKRRLRDVGRVR